MGVGRSLRGLPAALTLSTQVRGKNAVDYVINRIGSVENDGLRAHFMRDHSGDRTACGKRVVSSWDCTKDSGILNVDCGKCWDIKWGDN